MRKALLTVALVFVATVAAAQTVTPVTSASVVEFTPSVDHSVVDPISGVAKLERYDLETVAQNALGAVVFTQGLAKPAPVNNVITANIGATVAAITGGTVYQARVAAVGPGGVGRSALSNPFGKAAAQEAPAATGIPTIR